MTNNLYGNYMLYKSDYYNFLPATQLRKNGKNPNFNQTVKVLYIEKIFNTN